MSKQFTAKTFAWLRQINADVLLPTSAIKVAVCLSDYFNEEQGGVAWPSCSTIAAVIGKSEATVISAVRALHARGHLSVEWGKQGRGCSNRYWMIAQEKPQPAKVFETEKPQLLEEKTLAFEDEKPQLLELKPQPAKETLSNNHRKKERTTERKTLAPAALDADAPLHMNGFAKEAKQESGSPTRKEASKASKRPSPEEAEAFEEFFAVYPRRVARLGAAKAWDKALKQASAAQIITGARRYAVERHDQNPQYTKHPATWLNAGCWMDDPGANASHHEQTFAEMAQEIWDDVGAASRSEADLFGTPDASGPRHRRPSEPAGGVADLDLTPDEWARQEIPF